METAPAAPPTRRERLRAETTREIKSVALRLMAEGGPDAISLRAIAREMGMTAGAIYGYFDTRDTLVTALIQDVYGDLVDTVEAARDRCAPDDTAGRITAWGTALRAWSLAHPEGFRLVYGDAVHGYQPPEGGAAADAAERACAGLTGLVAAAWPTAKEFHDGDYTWADFSDHLCEVLRRDHPELPPAAAALGMRVWGRMHGLVALEVYGHTGPLTRDPGRLYEDELKSMVRELGLNPAA
jgi:AcrR family transcriptional regulator